MTELLQVFNLQQHHIRIDAIKLPHTNRFLVAEPQIFCRDQIGLRFVGTSACPTSFPGPFPWVGACRTLALFRLGADSIFATLEKALVHVSVMRIPHWLRYASASPAKLSWSTAHWPARPHCETL